MLSYYSIRGNVAAYKTIIMGYLGFNAGDLVRVFTSDNHSFLGHVVFTDLVHLHRVIVLSEDGRSVRLNSSMKVELVQSILL